MTTFKPGDLVVPKNKEEEKDIQLQMSFYPKVTDKSFPFVVQRINGALLYFTNGFGCFSYRLKQVSPKEITLEEWM